MYDLKTFFSKLFSQLRIPSEGEIRKLQSRQVENAHRQTDSFEVSAIGVRPNCDQQLKQRAIKTWSRRLRQFQIGVG